MRKNKFGLPAIALALFVMGCVPPMPVADIWTRVPYGMIKTEGVIIEAKLRDFTLRSGERFKTPFDQRGTWHNSGSSAPGMPNAGTYKACSGCRLVRVTVPGGSDKLYGALHFSQMHPDARGPGTRSYLIQIPRRYIDDASDGRVSVVYETVTHTDGITQTGWVLWLSDMPLSDCGIRGIPCQ